MRHCRHTESTLLGFLVTGEIVKHRPRRGGALARTAVECQAPGRELQGSRPGYEKKSVIREQGKGASFAVINAASTPEGWMRP